MTRVVLLAAVVGGVVGCESSAAAVPCLDVPACPDVATITAFTVLTSGTPGSGPAPGTADHRTTVSVCHLGHSALRLRWALHGAAVPAAFRTNLSRCHADVWEADAAEFYLAPLGPAAPFTPVNYTEIDVGPAAGAMWLGHIQNPSGFAPDNASYADLPECNRSGVTASVTHSDTGWTADVEVPLRFVAAAADLPTSRWRANLYRWSGHPRVLTAWSPTSCTAAGNHSCNLPHVPRDFGVWEFV